MDITLFNIPDRVFLGVFMGICNGIFLALNYTLYRINSNSPIKKGARSIYNGIEGIVFKISYFLKTVNN